MSMQVTTTANGWYQNCKTTQSSWQDQGYKLEVSQNDLNKKYQNCLDAGFSEDWAKNFLENEIDQFNEDYNNWIIEKEKIANPTFGTKLPDINNKEFWNTTSSYQCSDLKGETSLYNVIIQKLPEEGNVKEVAEICFNDGNYQLFMLMAVSCEEASDILTNLETLGDDDPGYKIYKLYYDVYNKNEENRDKYKYTECIEMDGTLKYGVGETLQQLTEEVQKQSNLEATGLESETDPLTLDKFIEHLYGDTSSLDTKTKKEIFEICYLLYEKFDTDDEEGLSADELMNFYDGIDAADGEKDGVYSFKSMDSFMRVVALNQRIDCINDGKDEYYDNLIKAYKEWNN